jgi:hypothetical protein
MLGKMGAQLELFFADRELSQLAVLGHDEPSEPFMRLCLPPRCRTNRIQRAPALACSALNRRVASGR